MKKILVLILWVLLVVNIAHSATLVHGVLHKNTPACAYYLPASFKEIPLEFPRKHYGVRANLFDIKYDRHVPLKDRKLDFNQYSIFQLEGDLELISFDKKEHLYTFKLTLKLNSAAHSLKTNGNLKFYGNQDSCLIHGRYLEGKEPKFINMPSTDDCKIRIDRLSKVNEVIYITFTENISVTLELA